MHENTNHIHIIANFTIENSTKDIKKIAIGKPQYYKGFHRVFVEDFNHNIDFY